MLKEKFLSYVELQASAEHAKYAYGASADKSVKAFEKANDAKRKLIKLIEEYESGKASTE